MGVGCHSFLHGIFPTQGSNLGLLHCRQILYHLSHQPCKNLENIVRVWIKGLQRRVEGVLMPDSRIKMNRAEKAWMTFHGWWRQKTKMNRPFLWWDMFEACRRDVCWHPILFNIFNNHLEQVAHWNEATHSDIVSQTHTPAHPSGWRFRTSHRGDS